MHSMNTCSALTKLDCCWFFETTYYKEKNKIMNACVNVGENVIICVFACIPPWSANSSVNPLVQYCCKISLFFGDGCPFLDFNLNNTPFHTYLYGGWSTDDTLLLIILIIINGRPPLTSNQHLELFTNVRERECVDACLHVSQQKPPIRQCKDLWSIDRIFWV